MRARNPPQPRRPRLPRPLRPLRLLRHLHLALRLGLRAVQRWHASYPRWEGPPPHQAGCSPLPPPGQPDGAAAHGPWVLAWISRAGPHHLNQDCAGARWLADPSNPGLALAVADGVTNGAAGDVAALALCQHWLAGPQAGADRRDFLVAAETAVRTALRQHTHEPGAATGAACWLGADGCGWATRVGDCQLLLAAPRHGPGHTGAASAPAWHVQALMADQTFAQVYPHLYRQAPLAPHSDPQQSHAQAEDRAEDRADDRADAEADSPADFQAHDDAQQPARMVGCGSLGEPEWIELSLGAQELLLLASDGLHSALTPGDWAAALQRHLGAPHDGHALANTLHTALTAPTPATLQALVADLLQTAVMRGSEDDITLVVVARASQAQANAQGPLA